uniref:trace amine-associated receptor 1-like n=1 Tax=Gasterosteus aculeatus aculeatus TaxID=481459 RepID=UPI001A9990E3|nr:trace amine-associated receptor 1-like [Gasterosteus aculeatus aculeatus]
MLTYILLSSISLLTVTLNLLVIISISHFRQLHTPANLLLLSLAVSDFFVGFIVFFQIVLIEGCWFLGDLMCILYIVLDYIVTSASVGTMVLISVDRYVAICEPLHYSNKTLLLKDNLEEPVLPHKFSVNITAKKSEMKAARTLGVIIVVFLLCVCPYYLACTVFVIQSSSVTFVIWLFNCNSCLNPLIYAILYPWFRKSIRLIVTLQILKPGSYRTNIHAACV